MEGYKVLITTSGLGSRLGNITDYTNKSLVRVGNKPVISHIIESYPNTVEFIVTLGHYGNQVKDFLELAYPKKNFVFVEIDKYKGEGSSLLYTISKCEKVINSPFIFHACDTILDNYEVINVNHNWVIGSNKKNSYHYRTLNIDNNNLLKINEKGEIGFDLSYVGVCGVKDHQLFFDTLKIILNEEKNNELSDVHVINKMLKTTSFSVYENNYWFDIGNTSELSKTRKHFQGDIEVLDKKDESIFFFEDFVIKFFFDNKINKNRVQRALKLKELTPKIIGEKDNFYMYEKIKGEVFSKTVNAVKFKNFIKWSNDELWVDKKNSDIKNVCYDFYINKTIKRIKEYLKSDFDREEVINGENIPSVFDVIKNINVDWLCDGIPSQFHGDFILDNIIETNENYFKLIDWRQDFGGDLEVGDRYYDLAKLNHNLTVNHNIVGRNLFSSNGENCYILTNSKFNECKEILYKYIKDRGYDLKKVQTLTSIIWLNMSPLHEHPFSSFLFKFGKYNLYKNLTEND